MPLNLRLVVATPEAKLLDLDVLWVQVPLSDGGSIGIWPGHGPLVAETVCGALRYADDAGEHSVPLRPGVLQIGTDGVIVYTTGLAQASVSGSAVDPDFVLQTGHRLVDVLKGSPLG